MNVRAITVDELHLFAELSGDPHYFAQMVKGMWEAGETRPGWCFIIEQDGQVVGRVGYLVIDNQPDVAGLFGWALPWDGDYLALGRHLIAESLAQLRPDGVRTVLRELNAVWATCDQQAEVLQAVGFSLLQEQCVYEYVASGAEVAVPSRLTYRSLAEVDDDYFRAVIERATVGGLDRMIQQEIAEKGLAGFVAHSYAFIKTAHEVDPTWWRLAYTEQGELVGFTQAVRFPGHVVGNVAYMGVVPAQRGNGYGTDLLRVATDDLLASGVESITARTDGENVPMQRAFERVGYELMAQVAIYQKRLM